jgi:hypothetical protein
VKSPSSKPRGSACNARSQQLALRVRLNCLGEDAVGEEGEFCDAESWRKKDGIELELGVVAQAEAEGGDNPSSANS